MRSRLHISIRTSKALVHTATLAVHVLTSFPFIATPQDLYSIPMFREVVVSIPSRETGGTTDLASYACVLGARN